MSISLILAIANNGVIGARQGRYGLPWHIPQDLAWFRQHTLGKAIIMGRKTFDHIGRPLDNRTNIVLTRNTELQLQGCHIAHDLEQALHTAPDLDVMIIGGASLFELTLDMAEHCYLTRVLADVEGDTSMRHINWGPWEPIAHINCEQDAASHPFEHWIYRKRR